MFSKKRALIATAVAVAVTAIAGCSGGSSDPDPSTSGTGGGEVVSGGTLTLGTIQPLVSFSAQNANWANNAPYVQAVYDSLLRAEPDGTIVGHLASEWSWSEDLLTLTMTIRDDVTFIDGTTLNADVAAQNVLRFRDGTSPNASNLSRVADAVAVDEYTLEITLSEPDPAMETYLTQNGGLIASAESFDSPDVETVPVGSGPYILNQEDTITGTSYVFDRNPDYWAPELQHYDRVVMNLFTDPTSLVNAVQGGQVNGTATLDASTFPQMEAAGYTLVTKEAEWTGLMLSDVGGTINPAMAEVEVRQAINYALDRASLLTALGNGYGTVTTQIFPTTSPGYDAALEDRYPYDPEMARQLLAEAGYADGFELVMPSTSAVPAAWFTLIQQQLADVGITVVYEDLPISDYISDLIAGNYAAAWFQLQQDPIDFQLASFQIAAASTFNVTHYEDPIVEDLVARLQVSDEAASVELNEYIVEQAWFAPIYRPQTAFVVDATTTAPAQVGNSYPYLWYIEPTA